MKFYKLFLIFFLGILSVFNFAQASFDCVTILNNYYAMNSNFERYDSPEHNQVRYKRPSYAKYRFKETKCADGAVDVYGKCDYKNKVYLTKINTNF